MNMDRTYIEPLRLHKATKIPLRPSISPGLAFEILRYFFMVELLWYSRQCCAPMHRPCAQSFGVLRMVIKRNSFF